MGRPLNKIQGAIVLALAVVGLCRSSVAELETQPMKDFVYPLEFHENGQVKIRLQAKTVAMNQDDKDRLHAEGVLLEFFDEEGNDRGSLAAVQCIVDRKRKLAFSEDGAIRFERKGLVLTGRGFRFHMDRQRVHILDDVRVEVIGRPEGIGALRPASREG